MATPPSATRETIAPGSLRRLWICDAAPPVRSRLAMVEDFVGRVTGQQSAKHVDKEAHSIPFGDLLIASVNICHGLKHEPGIPKRAVIIGLQ